MGDNKVLRRFYEPLLLLDALGPIRGKHIKSHIPEDHSGSDGTKLRRAFADVIAYICAYEKIPDCVTAAAFERTPEGVTIWLAANTTISEHVVDFLQGIMGIIQRIAHKQAHEEREDEGQAMFMELLTRIVEFNQKRVRLYYDQVVKLVIEDCPRILDQSQTPARSQRQRNALVRWLHRYFGNQKNHILGMQELVELVQASHRERRSPQFKLLEDLGRLSKKRPSECEKLFKLLCKLGKHVHCANVLIEGAMYLSADLWGDFTIRTVPSPKEERLPLAGGKAGTVEGTIGRMFTSPEEQQNFRSRLQSIWEPAEISKILQSSKQNTKTKVHAELILLHHFDNFQLQFLDGADRYIGCSKPACYLCHAYIQSHPGQYAVPASHQKLYVGWRPPGVGRMGTSGVEIPPAQRIILLAMIEWVRKALTNEIESRTDRLPYHTDSTSGLTSNPRARNHAGSSIFSMSEIGSALGDFDSESSYAQNTHVPHRRGSELDSFMRKSLTDSGFLKAQYGRGWAGSQTDRDQSNEISDNKDLEEDSDNDDDGGGVRVV